MQYYRGIGWMGNNGGGLLLSSTILKYSFYKTDDDTIKFKQNVTTSHIVIWHGYNAAAYQWGEFGHSIQEPVRNFNWTIIESENNIPNIYNGTNTQHRSNAILAIPDGSGDELNGPFEFHNFTVDCDISNLFLWQIDNNGYFRNIHFFNLLIRGKIINFNMINTNSSTAKISNITFHNFSINGKQILNINDTELKLYWTGNVDINSIKFYK